VPNKFHSTRHLDIFNYIVCFKTKNNGLAPTIRELAQDFNTSTSLIKYHLRRLADMGLIEFYGNKRARSIMVPGGDWRMIPEVKEQKE